MNNKALLIVDVQNDFCPGGALAVEQGDTIVPVLNKYIQHFCDRGLGVLASRDWHPPETSHFKDFGGVWPLHCVRDTEGAAFYPDLHLPIEAVIISKGMDPESDSYSAFQGINSAGKTLKDILQENAIAELYVGGLATDYCVKASCLDALDQGLKVCLLVDAILGVNVKPQDSEDAIKLMVEKGVQKLIFEDIKD